MEIFIIEAVYHINFHFVKRDSNLINYGTFYVICYLVMP